MNETMVTLVGHVATEPALRMTTGGARVTSFRLASTERRFDKGINAWRDAHTDVLHGDDVAHHGRERP